MIFRDNHYKSNHIGGDLSYCFRLDFNGETIGGAVYGPPRHNVYGENVLDLRRFACIDDAPKNSESFFLSKTIKYLIKHKLANSILTYADETQGHKGTIYKACNFRKIGEVKNSKYILWDGKQYHMRSLTIDRPYSYRLRLAIKTGAAKIIDGKHKNVFLFP